MPDFPENLFKHCPKCGFETFQKFGKSKLECQSCNFTFYINMCSTAVVFIFNEKGEILLGKRTKDPQKGLFGLPGGMVDFDETAEEAAMREAWEEVNLKVSELKYLTSQTNYYEYKDVIYHLLDFYYIAKVEDFSTMKAADETDELIWLKPE
jgi:NADH pyrophosphatase NudC (nudix superfamily)